ncbi:MAG TPA: acetate/propionate family kinase [Gaiellales bacterium]|nr:acetate/propionate family kinase [Gaiellales bacterium]
MDARARRRPSERGRLDLALLNVLAVNAGSTSLKLHLVDGEGASTRVTDLDAVDAAGLEAVAHRVVHGGDAFREPAVIDDAVLEAIIGLEPLAPLHNAPALEAIDDAMRRLPGIPHVAVFDTLFHATMPSEAREYAIPRAWREDWSVRRYGFHGLSVAWSVERAAALLGRPAGDLRLVVCHLGGGCSVTAVAGGCSRDTTMGFSPLEGVPMATRSGSVDPAIPAYLVREHGMDAAEVERALTAESGLLGLGGSADMRELDAAAAAGDQGARLAIDVFCHRVAAGVGSMAVSADGLDAVVFTGGIGEGSAMIRRRISTRLGVLGVELDDALNDAASRDGDISTAASRARVLVVASREELIAARAARACLARV